MTSNSDETRVVDAKTGGEKGSKLARFDLIPQDVLWELAEHYGRGAQKYADRNWEKGYAWGLSVAALQRHLSAWLQGEDIDAETGGNHLNAVAWHAFALRAFQRRGLGTDDRAVTAPAPAPVPVPAPAPAPSPSPAPDRRPVFTGDRGCSGCLFSATTASTYPCASCAPSEGLNGSGFRPDPAHSNDYRGCARCRFMDTPAGEFPCVSCAPGYPLGSGFRPDGGDSRWDSGDCAPWTR